MVKLLVIVLFSLGTVLGQNSGATSAEDQLIINSLDTSIDHLAIADRSCEETVDCQALSIGHKACGGPARYVVTGKRNPHTRSIGVLSEKIIEIESKYPLINDCTLVGPPHLGCKGNVCIPLDIML